MKRKTIITIIIMLILLGFTFEVYKMRGGEWISATQEYDVPKALECYSQKDDTWKNDTLGDSKYTLESSGCLVSCMASIYSMEQQMRMTPQGLNQLFSEKEIYNDGNVTWEKLSELGIKVELINQGFDSKMIEEYLEKGSYPIVRVEVPIICKAHYVLIVGAKDGHFLCMDPLDDHIVSLSKYWNRIYAIRTFTTF